MLRVHARQHFQQTPVGHRDTTVVIALHAARRVRDIRIVVDTEFEHVAIDGKKDVAGVRMHLLRRITGSDSL